MMKYQKIKETVEISIDARHIYIKEDDYIFRNFFGDVEFTQGLHYWEIIADARTEHEPKIGVSKIKDLR